MRHLLSFAYLIDRINSLVGHAVSWLILGMVLVSSGNAISRKAFQLSSNAFLEIQWYFFAGVFLLGAAYTLQKNEHVRIDILSARLSARGQAWLDIAGACLFLLPLCAVLIYFSWPFFLQAFLSREASSSPGGLILWPAKFLIPLGFILLALQGIAEIIKRASFLLGYETTLAPVCAPEQATRTTAGSDR